MRKGLKTVLTIVLAGCVLCMAAACSNTKTEEKTPEKQESAASEAASANEKEETAQTPASWKDAFEKDGDVYTAVVTSETPVAGGGLVVEVDTAAHTVRYTICDTSGNKTVEYLLMNYDTELIERFQYVSAMGQGFYYYADLEGNDLSVFNTDGEDRTQGSIDSNHYQPAVDATKEMIQSYSSFFETQFGIPADEAAFDA